MAIIGITGSIASGKSTFRDILAPILQSRVLDADIIAREFLEKDPDVRTEVQAGISSGAYAEDGSPDRFEIRRIIFSDPGAKARLEAILHPRVREAWLAGANFARQENHHLIVDIPLLFETNAAPHFDFVITVACSPDVQNTRLMARGLDVALAHKIVRSQAPVSEKIARSSHVVWNDGRISVLKAQAECFAAWIHQRESDTPC